MNSSELENARDERVVIKGIATNAKAGAVVVTARDEVIYLKGMKDWPDDFVGERVVVDGTLHSGLIYPDVIVEKGRRSQGLPGEQWFLELYSYQKD